MRYLCVYKPGTHQPSSRPSEKEMADMGALIADMTRAGVLLGTGGCQPTEKSVRLEIQSGRVSTTNGPLPEQSEHIGGYCLMQVKSKAEAVEWGKRFLALVQHGRSELFELEEFPPPAA